MSHHQQQQPQPQQHHPQSTGKKRVEWSANLSTSEPQHTESNSPEWDSESGKCQSKHVHPLERNELHSLKLLHVSRIVHLLLSQTICFPISSTATDYPPRLVLPSAFQHRALCLVLPINRWYPIEYCSIPFEPTTFKVGHPGDLWP